MSYGCEEKGGPSGVPTIGLMSSPNLAFNGLPAGDASRADCARTLTETRGQIAAARPTVNPPPPNTGSIITTGLSSSKCLDAPDFNLGTQVRISTLRSTVLGG